MSLTLTFATHTHFGSVWIQGRSGWGKTHTVHRILDAWKREGNDPDAVVCLSPDDYTSWKKWSEATITITNGQSVFRRFYKKMETYVIEDIHHSFLWNSSVRLKFLEQIQTIAKHSNVIVTMDSFGVKVPKVWTSKTSWNHIVKLSLPSTEDRLAFCRNDSVLSKLNTSQISFLLEITKDVSFRSLERIRHFIQQNDANTTITLSFLRQAAL